MNNILTIKGLNKHFDGVKAANDCTFEVEQGKITAIIGPNGSGKSTIFNLISGILIPDSGSIFFSSQNITRQTPEKIAAIGISRIFQQSRLFLNLTVKENLLLAMTENSFDFWSNDKPSKGQNDKIMGILRRLNIEKFADRQTREASFGQKRLIEIARAYLKPHKLLLLDEPIAGVNPHLREEIADFLVELRDNQESILIIEHDMNFVLKLADNVIVMDAGKIIASGSPESIKNNKEVIDAYLGV